MIVTNRNSRQWFEEAARCHLENHQGCAWCGRPHRVYKLNKGSLHTFCCQGCDFQVTFNEATGQFHHIAGEEISDTVTETMTDIEIPNQPLV